MIENVIEVGMYVDETFMVRKNRLMPDKVDENTKRMCIVTGTHGDELDGQLICFELIKRISENRECLKGIVDIYPCINPLGMESVSRGIPMFDLDMNRVFPGSEDGYFVEAAANAVVKDIEGTDICIDIHSSNIFIKEIPQVRLREENSDELLDYAKAINADFVWVHKSPSVLEATLAQSLNMKGIKTIVIEMGVGLKITKEYGMQITDGILNIMKKKGIWTGEIGEIREPIVSTDREVAFISAKESGVFIPRANHWEDIHKDELIGEIVNPLTGEVLDRVIAPCTGKIFTLREYPMIYKGALVARIIGA